MVLLAALWPRLWESPNPCGCEAFGGYGVPMNEDSPASESNLASGSCVASGDAPASVAQCAYASLWALPSLWRIPGLWGRPSLLAELVCVLVDVLMAVAFHNGCGLRNLVALCSVGIICTQAILAQVASYLCHAVVALIPRCLLW